MLINLIACLPWQSKKEGRRLVSMLGEKAQPCKPQLLALFGYKPPDADASAELMKRKFVAGKKIARYSRSAKKIDLTKLSLHGWQLPTRTIWSCERALERNPNDLILRAELIQAYTHYDQWHVHFGGFTPDVVPQLIRHNLWFIQNIPDYRLYSRGDDVSLSFGSDKRYLANHTILLEAARRQMKAYPNNLNVNLALIAYFPPGWEGEAISALTILKRFHPDNAELHQKLEHLQTLNDIRGL